MQTVKHKTIFHFKQKSRGCEGKMREDAGHYSQE